LTNVHNVRLKLVQDYRISKNSKAYGQENPELPVKIAVIAKGENQKIMSDRIIRVKKYPVQYFKKNFNQIFKSELQDYKKPLIEYNNVINQMDYWDFVVFKAAIRSDINTPIDYYFKEKIIALEQRNFRSGTTYETTRNSLIKFNGKMPTFQEIDALFLRRWQDWYMERARTGNGFAKYISNLKAIFNLRPKEESGHYPFGSKIGLENTFAATPSRANKFFVPQFVMQAIKSAELPTERQEFYRDIFMFSYYIAGINLIDIFKLRWNQYDELRGTLSWKRSKSMHKKDAKNITVKVTDQAKEIIERHCTERSIDGLIFGEMDGLSSSMSCTKKDGLNRQINKVVKKIAKDIEYEEWDKVTFYRARHTFATNLRGKIPHDMIKDLLGHESMVMVEVYLGAREEKELEAVRDIMETSLDQVSQAKQKAL